MKIPLISFLLVALLLTFQVHAQITTLQDLPVHNKRQIGVGLRVTFLNNAERSGEQIGRSYVAPEFDFFRSNFEKGGWNRSHRVKLFGDFFAMCIQMLRGEFDWAYQEDFTTEVNTFLGWHNWGVTAVSTDKLNVAAGFHLGDYMYYYYGGGKKKEPDFVLNPAGYYMGAGPAFIVDYRLGSLPLLLHYEGAAAYGFRVGDVSGQVKTEYADPFFLNNLLEIRSDFKLYAGFEYVTLINRGDVSNRGQRFEIKLGYRFYEKD
ncbi:MAG: hypothetical protein KF845_10710 [Cyclobacteriaceae bacterium]|nr:hypothetical protein [Cyclobacteriaceae bacterium]